MSRQINPLRLLLALLGVALAAWLYTVLEWVEVEVPPPPRRELQEDRFLVVEKLLVRLGATVTRPGNLDTLPPPGAQLLLDNAAAQDLTESRAERLKDWVEQGGHLVASTELLDEDELSEWLPMDLRRSDAPAAVVPPDGPRNSNSPLVPHAPGEAAAPAAPPAPLVRPARFPALPDCRLLTDTAPTAHRAGAPAESWSVCVPFGGYRGVDLLPDAGKPAPLWRMQGPGGTEMLRMPVGQGSVTLVRPWSLLADEKLLEGDNALALARMLQVGPGTAVWIGAEETREPLPLWVWRRAWGAVLLALAALALGLWRGALRFGPLAAPAGLQRRSIAEQVTGTGRFLLHHGAASLHAAQCRALAEAVRQRLPGTAGMTEHQRLLALATATALDTRALSTALGPLPARSVATLPATLYLLETARRRLLARHTLPPKETTL